MVVRAVARPRTRQVRLCGPPFRFFGSGLGVGLPIIGHCFQPFEGRPLGRQLTLQNFGFSRELE
jgi:hypothetical protein